MPKLILRLAKVFGLGVLLVALATGTFLVVSNKSFDLRDLAFDYLEGEKELWKQGPDMSGTTDTDTGYGDDEKREVTINPRIGQSGQPPPNPYDSCISAGNTPSECRGIQTGIPPSTTNTTTNQKAQTPETEPPPVTFGCGNLDTRSCFCTQSTCYINGNDGQTWTIPAAEKEEFLELVAELEEQGLLYDEYGQLSMKITNEDGSTSIVPLNEDYYNLLTGKAPPYQVVNPNGAAVGVPCLSGGECASGNCQASGVADAGGNFTGTGDSFCMAPGQKFTIRTNVPVGGDCGSNMYGKGTCASGLSCGVDGTCGQLNAALCTPGGAKCASGNCQPTDMGDWFCMPPGVKFTTTTNVPIGGSCGSSVYGRASCQGGSECVGGTCTSVISSCQSGGNCLPLGAACTGSGDCASNLCGAGGTCVAIVNGYSCTPGGGKCLSGNCQSSDIVGGYVCMPTGIKYTTNNNVGLGGGCGTSIYGSNQCGGGLTCGGGDATCKIANNSTILCESHGQCASGNCGADSLCSSTRTFLPTFQQAQLTTVTVNGEPTLVCTGTVSECGSIINNIQSTDPSTASVAQGQFYCGASGDNRDACMQELDQNAYQAELKGVIQAGELLVATAGILAAGAGVSVLAPGLIAALPSIAATGVTGLAISLSVMSTAAVNFHSLMLNAMINSGDPRMNPVLAPLQLEVSGYNSFTPGLGYTIGFDFGNMTVSDLASGYYTGKVFSYGLSSALQYVSNSYGNKGMFFTRAVDIADNLDDANSAYQCSQGDVGACQETAVNAGIGAGDIVEGFKTPIELTNAIYTSSSNKNTVALQNFFVPDYVSINDNIITRNTNPDYFAHSSGSTLTGISSSNAPSNHPQVAYWGTFVSNTPTDSGYTPQGQYIAPSQVTPTTGLAQGPDTSTSVTKPDRLDPDTSIPFSQPDTTTPDTSIPDSRVDTDTPPRTLNPPTITQNTDNLTIRYVYNYENNTWSREAADTGTQNWEKFDDLTNDELVDKLSFEITSSDPNSFTTTNFENQNVQELNEISEILSESKNVADTSQPASSIPISQRIGAAIKNIATAIRNRASSPSQNAQKPDAKITAPASQLPTTTKLIVKPLEPNSIDLPTQPLTDNHKVTFTDQKWFDIIPIYSFETSDLTEFATEKEVLGSTARMFKTQVRNAAGVSYPVAVKIYRPELATNLAQKGETIDSLLFDEVGQLDQLNELGLGPEIVGLAETPYGRGYVMEYVEGVDSAIATADDINESTINSLVETYYKLFENGLILMDAQFIITPEGNAVLIDPAGLTTISDYVNRNSFEELHDGTFNPLPIDIVFQNLVHSFKENGSLGTADYLIRVAELDAKTPNIINIYVDTFRTLSKEFQSAIVFTSPTNFLKYSGLSALVVVDNVISSEGIYPLLSGIQSGTQRVKTSITNITNYIQSRSETARNAKRDRVISQAETVLIQNIKNHTRRELSRHATTFKNDRNLAVSEIRSEFLRLAHQTIQQYPTFIEAEKILETNRLFKNNVMELENAANKLTRKINDSRYALAIELTKPANLKIEDGKQTRTVKVEVINPDQQTSTSRLFSSFNINQRVSTLTNSLKSSWNITIKAIRNTIIGVGLFGGVLLVLITGSFLGGLLNNSPKLTTPINDVIPPAIVQTVSDETLLQNVPLFLQWEWDYRPIDISDSFFEINLQLLKDSFGIPMFVSNKIPQNVFDQQVGVTQDMENALELLPPNILEATFGPNKLPYRFLINEVEISHGFTYSDGSVFLHLNKLENPVVYFQNPDIIQNANTATVLHEMLHSVDGVNPELTKQFVEAARIDGVHFSENDDSFVDNNTPAKNDFLLFNTIKTNEREGFSLSGVAYILAPEQLRLEQPTVYQFFKEKVFNGVEYYEVVNSQGERFIVPGIDFNYNDAVLIQVQNNVNTIEGKISSEIVNPDVEIPPSELVAQPEEPIQQEIVPQAPEQLPARNTTINSQYINSGVVRHEKSARLDQIALVVFAETANGTDPVWAQELLAWSVINRANSTEIEQYYTGALGVLITNVLGESSSSETIEDQSIRIANTFLASDDNGKPVNQSGYQLKAFENSVECKSQCRRFTNTLNVVQRVYQAYVRGEQDPTNGSLYFSKQSQLDRGNKQLQDAEELKGWLTNNSKLPGQYFISEPFEQMYWKSSTDEILSSGKYEILYFGTNQCVSFGYCGDGTSGLLKLFTNPIVPMGSTTFSFIPLVQNAFYIINSLGVEITTKLRSLDSVDSPITGFVDSLRHRFVINGVRSELENATQKEKSGFDFYQRLADDLHHGVLNNNIDFNSQEYEDTRILLNQLRAEALEAGLDESRINQIILGPASGMLAAPYEAIPSQKTPEEIYSNIVQAGKDLETTGNLDAKTNYVKSTIELLNALTAKYASSQLEQIKKNKVGGLDEFQFSLVEGDGFLTDFYIETASGFISRVLYNPSPVERRVLSALKDPLTTLSQSEIEEEMKIQQSITKVHLNVPPEKRFEFLTRYFQEMAIELGKLNQFVTDHNGEYPSFEEATDMGLGLLMQVQTIKFRGLTNTLNNTVLDYQGNRVPDFIFYVYRYPDSRINQASQNVARILSQLTRDFDSGTDSPVRYSSLHTSNDGYLHSNLSLSQGDGDFKNYLVRNGLLDNYFDKDSNYSKIKTQKSGLIGSGPAQWFENWSQKYIYGKYPQAAIDGTTPRMLWEGIVNWVKDIGRTMGISIKNIFSTISTSIRIFFNIPSDLQSLGNPQNWTLGNVSDFRNPNPESALEYFENYIEIYPGFYHQISEYWLKIKDKPFKFYPLQNEILKSLKKTDQQAYDDLIKYHNFIYQIGDVDIYQMSPSEYAEFRERRNIIKNKYPEKSLVQIAKPIADDIVYENPDQNYPGYNLGAVYIPEDKVLGERPMIVYSLEQNNPKDALEKVGHEWGHYIDSRFDIEDVWTTELRQQLFSVKALEATGKYVDAEILSRSLDYWILVSEGNIEFEEYLETVTKPHTNSVQEPNLYQTRSFGVRVAASLKAIRRTLGVGFKTIFNTISSSLNIISSNILQFIPQNISNTQLTSTETLDIPTKSELYSSVRTLLDTFKPSECSGSSCNTFIDQVTQSLTQFQTAETYEDQLDALKKTNQLLQNHKDDNQIAYAYGKLLSEAEFFSKFGGNRDEFIVSVSNLLEFLNQAEREIKSDMYTLSLITSIRQDLNSIIQTFDINQIVTPEEDYPTDFSKFVYYTIGIWPEAGKEYLIQQRMLEDQPVIRAKYNLPLLELYKESPSEYIHQLEILAKQVGTTIRPSIEFQRYFDKGTIAGVFNDSENTIIVKPVDMNNFDEIKEYANTLEHELIHSLQSNRYPGMPIEAAEYEAYIAGQNATFVEKDPLDAIKALFGFYMQSSVEFWYKDQDLLLRPWAAIETPIQ